MGGKRKSRAPDSPAPEPVAPLFPLTDATGGYKPDRRRASGTVLNGGLGTLAEPNTAKKMVLGG